MEGLANDFVWRANGAARAKGAHAEGAEESTQRARRWLWLPVRGLQMVKQIPCGDDNKKGKGNSKGKGEGDYGVCGQRLWWVW